MLVFAKFSKEHDMKLSRIFSLIALVALAASLAGCCCGGDTTTETRIIEKQPIQTNPLGDDLIKHKDANVPICGRLLPEAVNVVWGSVDINESNDLIRHLKEAAAHVIHGDGVPWSDQCRAALVPEAPTRSIPAMKW